MKLHPLEPENAAFGITTFGCMWKKGECQPTTEFVCHAKSGDEIPMQSRITAYWPDGSVKWTAHSADAALLGQEIDVTPGDPKNYPGMKLEEDNDEIRVSSGKISVVVKKDGKHLFSEASRCGKVFLQDVLPELILEEPFEQDGNPARKEKSFEGRIDSVSVEESGSIKTILRYDGIHVSKNGEAKIPFIIRMELGFNNPNLKFTHTFLYDGDENKDFLKGLGIRFSAPLSGELYNRHVKFTADHGVFHEALVPMLSWRPKLSPEDYASQMRGEELHPDKETLEKLSFVLENVPHWSEYRLAQTSVNHFSVTKKQAGNHLCAIDCLHGNRTHGGASFGSSYGSVTVAIRDFWEKYPSGIDFTGLESNLATGHIWFYTPSAQAFDFRHYADRGYNQVCYEGYDYKGADPDGIACTNECSITFSEEMIPSDEFLKEFTKVVNSPTVYVGTPEFYHAMRAFGYWSLPSRETEMENWLEDQLDAAFAFYKQEVDQRNWYGLFNFGDFMHTYDAVRHCWKYDIGGYAWDNTELVPTLWLWQYFCRTGRADVFRMAEKLSRHASEVDVYHMGKYKGLGSRHNVRHWGCPCKEARIAMAAHHRYYYYMTGDRRLEDIFEELKDNEMSFLNKDPLGDFFDKKDMVYPSHARSGPDWSSLCSNWMTRWERFNDTKYRDKILVGIGDLKAAPLKLVSGPDFEFDPATCHLRYIGERTTGGCHLQVCMGAPSVWTEIADLLEDEEWKSMIANLGRFYFLPREEQMQESNGLVGERQFTFPLMATAVGAYGAKYLGDDILAERTWRNLLMTILKPNNADGFQSVLLIDTGNQENLVEIPWISTNYTAQFCLNAIMVLDFIREKMPKTLEEARRLVEGGDSAFHGA